MMRAVKKHASFGWWELLLILGGLAILFFVTRAVGFGRVVASAAAIKKTHVLAAAIVLFSALALDSLKLKTFASELGRISFFRAARVFLAGIFVENITPGAGVGGEPVKIYYLEKDAGETDMQAAAVVTFDSAVNGANSFLFALFGVGAAIFFIPVPGFRAVLGGLLATMVILAAAVYEAVMFTIRGEHGRFGWVVHAFYRAFMKKRFATYREFALFLSRKAKKFVVALKELWGDKPKLVTAILCSFAAYMFFFLKDWVLFRGLGLEVGIARVIIAGSIALMASKLVLIPGGAGALEGMMIGAYSAMGIDAGAAAAVTLVGRAMYYFGAYVMGYLSLLSLEVGGGAKPVA